MTAARMNRVKSRILFPLVVLPGFLLHAAASQGTPSYRDILFELKRQFDSLNDYRCVFDSFSSVGNRELRVRYEYFFRKPDRVRMKALDGKFPGSIMLYRDGKVRVKPVPILFPFLTLTFRPVDRQVTDLRGRGVHQSGWGWLIDQHMAKLECIECTSIRQEMHDDTSVLVLDLVSTDAAETDGMARETLIVDPARRILLEFSMYDGTGRLVQAAKFTDIRIDTGMDERLFTDF